MKWRVFHKRMLWLRASTEEKLVREKRTKYVLFYKKITRISRGLYDHKTYCVFSSSVNIINSVQRRQRQSDAETLWPWASIRSRNLLRENIIRVMESSVATFTVFYRTSHIVDVQHPNILLWKFCINVSAVRNGHALPHPCYFITNSAVQFSYDS